MDEEKIPHCSNSALVSDEVTNHKIFWNLFVDKWSNFCPKNEKVLVSLIFYIYLLQYQNKVLSKLSHDLTNELVFLPLAYEFSAYL